MVASKVPSDYQGQLVTLKRTLGVFSWDTHSLDLFMVPQRTVGRVFRQQQIDHPISSFGHKSNLPQTGLVHGSKRYSWEGYCKPQSLEPSPMRASADQVFVGFHTRWEYTKKKAHPHIRGHIYVADTGLRLTSLNHGWCHGCRR